MITGRPGVLKTVRSWIFWNRICTGIVGRSGKKQPGNILIYRGKNPAEETAYVCSCINEKVQKEGLRYRDMAVVTGDLASYGKEIAHRFDEAGIPYFLDDKKAFWKFLLLSL